MKILVEKAGLASTKLQPIPYADEVADFHSYFQLNVKTILGLEDQPKLVTHHASIEGKEIDYLIVDRLDRVYFVEIKLGRNPENRRAVISQIVDYWLACKAYVADMELPPKARRAIEGGYVNPVIVTDELLDEHRDVLAELKLGVRNLKIRLIEVKRWSQDGGVLLSINTINDREPISYPQRDLPRSAEELISAIEDKSLREFARNLDRLMRRHGLKIKQRSRSRLAYTMGPHNRLFVFVCTRPVFGDRVGDFVRTQEYFDIGLPGSVWDESIQGCEIQDSGRRDYWRGEIYELGPASEEARDGFLKHLDKVLAQARKAVLTPASSKGD